MIADISVDMLSNRLYSCGLSHFFRIAFHLLAIPLPLRGRAQVDAADQQRKLLAAQLHTSILRHGPVQSASLHAPRADPQAVAVEEENLHAIAALVRKQEQMTALRILPQRAGRESIQTIEGEA